MIRKKEHMFEKVFLTALQQEILWFLSLRPAEEFHLRNISMTTGRSVSGCHKALKELERSEHVTSRISGRNKYFKISRTDPSIRSFKIFVNSSMVRELVKPYRDHIFRAILYGSCSRGDDTNGSDIDLFMVVSDMKAVSDMPVFLDGRRVQKKIVNMSEIMGLRKTDPAYIDEVEKGIEIWGSDDDRLL